MRRRSEDLTDDVVVTSKKRCSDASDDRTTVEKRGCTVVSFTNVPVISGQPPFTLYRFSGNVLTREAGEMPVAVQQCLAFVADRDQQPTSRYWALVNWYPHASDYISAHTDDESEVGVVSGSDGPAVATFTFGAVPRIFRIVRKPSSRRHAQPLLPPRWDIALPHGSCAIMAGTRFQAAYTHEVRPLSRAAVRTAEAAGHAIGRLSITVRARCDAAAAD